MRRYLIKLLGGVPREDFEKLAGLVKNSHYVLGPYGTERQRELVLAWLKEGMAEFGIRQIFGRIMFGAEIVEGTIKASKLRVDSAVGDTAILSTISGKD